MPFPSSSHTYGPAPDGDAHPVTAASATRLASPPAPGATPPSGARSGMRRSSRGSLEADLSGCRNSARFMNFDLLARFDSSLRPEQRTEARAGLGQRLDAELVAQQLDHALALHERRPALSGT